MRTGSNPPGSEGPVLYLVGERVAVGPLRAELLPLYGRWINDFATVRMLGLPPVPVTTEKERVTASQKAAGTSWKLGFPAYGVLQERGSGARRPSPACYKVRSLRANLR